MLDDICSTSHCRFCASACRFFVSDPQCYLSVHEKKHLHICLPIISKLTFVEARFNTHEHYQAVSLFPFEPFIF